MNEIIYFTSYEQELIDRIAQVQADVDVFIEKYKNIKSCKIVFSRLSNLKTIYNRQDLYYIFTFL